MSSPTTTYPIPTNPVIIHDQSNAMRLWDPRTPYSGQNLDVTSIHIKAQERIVNGGIGGGTQRTQTFNNTSMTNAMTYNDFINFTQRDPSNYFSYNPLQNRTGTVDMQKYITWLNTPSNGYCLWGQPCMTP